MPAFHILTRYLLFRLALGALRALSDKESGSMLQSQIKTSPVVVFSVLSGLHQGQKVVVHLGETMTVGRSSSLEISTDGTANQGG